MQNDTTIKIGKRVVGVGYPTYTIFEVASTHGNDWETASAYVKQAKDAGADAVKFQLFEADKLLNSISSHLQQTYEYFKRSETPREWFPKLKRLCDENDIDLLCTPFDEETADFLNEVGVPAVKIASGDMTHLSLLRHVAKFGKPVILSTGTATMEEVKIAVATLRQGGCEDIVVLQCVSVYPMAFEQANVAAMNTLREELKTLVGYSDNGSPGFLVPLVAVANGATVIEKHVTSKKERGDLDDTFSLSVKEFSEMTRRIHELEGMSHEEASIYIKGEYDEEAMSTVLGSGIKEPMPAPEGKSGSKGGVSAPSELEERYWVRRGVYPSRDIEKGERIREGMLILLRPDVGVSALKYDEVIGQVALETLPCRMPILLGKDGICKFRREDIDEYYGGTASEEFVSVLKENALF